MNVPAAKDGELSSVSGTHMEKEKNILQVGFSDIYTVIWYVYL